MIDRCSNLNESEIESLEWAREKLLKACIRSEVLLKLTAEQLQNDARDHLSHAETHAEKMGHSKDPDCSEQINRRLAKVFQKSGKEVERLYNRIAIEINEAIAPSQKQ